MSDALPCIACRKPLTQAFAEGLSDHNQPSNGVCATTIGNYGSTVFDSIMGTSRLVFSVCDDCLKQAGADGIVMYWRQAREVVTEEHIEGFTTPAHAHVGWEPLDRPLIPWDPAKNWENDDDDDVLVVDPEEVGTKMGKVEWR